MATTLHIFVNIFHDVQFTVSVAIKYSCISLCVHNVNMICNKSVL